MPPEQTHYVEQAKRGLLEIFQNLLCLQMPSRADFVGCAETLNQLQAVGLILVAVVYLLCGYRYFKILVIVNGAAFGALLGAFLGLAIGRQLSPLLMSLAGAALLGVLAWPTIKYAVGIMGALSGAVIGYAAWYMLTTAAGNESMRQQSWVGGVIGLVVVGMIAFVVFRAAVMIFTALQGAIMLVGGVFSLLLRSESICTSVRPVLVGNDLLLGLLIGIPAAIGFTMQYASDTAKIHKKRKATEKQPV